MDKSKHDVHFRLMALFFKFRDFFMPPKNILKEAGIQPGFHVLDFGCGPGSYIIPASKLVGDKGKIYALDISPLAIKSIQKIIAKKRLTNVETIQSDCKTGLQDNSIDIVLCYDTLHELHDPEAVLEKLHRVLKPEGILSFSDHHLKENEILSKLTHRESFKLSKMGKKTYSFVKGEIGTKDS